MVRINRLLTVLLLVALILGACQPIVAEPATQQTEKAAMQVMDQFFAAYRTNDIDKLLALHTPDAVWTWIDPGKNFPAFGAEGKWVESGSEGIRKMFKFDRGEGGFTGYMLWSTMQGNTVKATELWESDYSHQIDVPLITESTYTLRDGKIAAWLWIVSPESSGRFMNTLSAAEIAAKQYAVKGDIHFMVPEWGNLAISFHVDVHEINSATHEASGPVNWSIYSFTPQEGGNWRILETQAKYALFGAEIPGADSDTVVLITQITSHNGWGQGEPGEYAYFWLKDSGQPDGKGDQWGDISYKLDPWTEYFPANDPPSVTNYITVEQLKQSSSNLPLHVEMGDVQIIHPVENQ